MDELIYYLNRFFRIPEYRLLYLCGAVLVVLLLLLIVKIRNRFRFKKKLKDLNNGLSYDAMKDKLAFFRAEYQHRKTTFMEGIMEIEEQCKELFRGSSGLSLEDDWYADSQNELDKKNMTVEEAEIFQLLNEAEDLRRCARWEDDSWKTYLEKVRLWKNKYPESWLSLQRKKKYKKACKLCQRITADYSHLLEEQKKPLETASFYEKKLEALKKKFQELSRLHKQASNEFLYSLLAEKADGSILAYRSCFDNHLTRRSRPFSLLDEMFTDSSPSLRTYFKENLKEAPVTGDRIMIYAAENGLIWESRYGAYSTPKQGKTGRILFRNNAAGNCTALLLPGIRYQIQFGSQEIWYLHVLGNDF